MQGKTDKPPRIGGAIGAGLFVGTGNALQEGGPGSLVCGPDELAESGKRLTESSSSSAI